MVTTLPMSAGYAAMKKKKKRMLCTLCLIRWRSSQIGCDRHSVVVSLREGAPQENEGVSETRKKAS